MKIIFCADLNNISASGHQRLWALKQCGVEVVVFNKESFQPVLGRLSGRIAKLLHQPQFMRNSRQLGLALIELCKRIKPDLIWFEWPREIQPNILHQLRQITPKPFLISFQDDNPWGDRRNDQWIWRDYFRLIPEFDLHLVKRLSDSQNLIKLGAKSCRLWEHGVYSPLFHVATSTNEKKYPVSFVGTCMDQRIELISFLLDNKVPIHVFGNRWKQRSDLPRKFPKNFHDAVEGESYATVIRQSQICLGLVSHSNRDEWTMRTYEVPGCAVLLLAERTPAHQRLFNEDSEAMFFSTPEECLTKIQSLLPDSDHCRILGEAAYQKCIRENWMLEGRMQELLNFLIQQNVPAKNSTIRL